MQVQANKPQVDSELFLGNEPDVLAGDFSMGNVSLVEDFWWGEENGSEKKLDQKKKKKKRRVLLRKKRKASEISKKLNVVKGQWTPQEDW